MRTIDLNVTRFTPFTNIESLRIRLMVFLDECHFRTQHAVRFIITNPRTKDLYTMIIFISY